MSNEYLYANSENISSAKKSNGKIERGLKRLLVVAVIIFAAQLIWLFGISPFIPFSTVEVHGFSGLNRDEVLSLAGIDENSSYISTNVKDVKERVSGHILVESAVVMKKFPDRLSIFLTAREAAAVALMRVNSGQLPLLIDRNGVFFKIGDPASAQTANLPVISGLDNPQLNMRLPVSLVALVKNLSEMASSSPELLSAISEIRIEPKTWDGYDFVLFPVHSSIRVRIEDTLSEATLRYVLLMLNVIENSESKPEEIDFRSGMGSYRIGEKSL